MWLSVFHHAATPKGRADMAGVIVGVRIFRINHELHPGGERQHALIADCAFRERAESDTAMHEAGSQQIRHSEFRGIAVARALLVGERLPQPVHRSLRHLADDFGNFLGFDAARGQPARTIDIGLRHGPAWIRLERQRVRHPARAEIAGQRVVIALRGMCKAMEQPVHALEHRAWSEKPCPRQERRADTRLRRPSGMHPLGPGAFREIFDDAAGHAAGNAERIDDLPGVEAKRCTDTGGRAHRAEDRGRVETGLVDSLRHHEAQPAQYFGADGDPDQRHAAIRIMPFAGGQHSRHYHGTGMHRATLESVVKILAMRRSAIDEGGAVIVAARQRASDVVLVARSDA